MEYNRKTYLVVAGVLLAAGVAVYAYMPHIPSKISGIPVKEICAYSDELFQNSETANRWTGGNPIPTEAEIQISRGLDETTSNKFHDQYGQDMDTVWLEWIGYVGKYGFHACNK